ncbi:uncharacterized protein LOC125269757 [Megalobrama amblycephala]|uniref:uncharacterized protein LOC125269757 n=1 Tax=Megalobrama amblycephala TaxID=75352 RepID=UPI0020141A18|nr:uncharacterized protein LOC125269757 [Megalobrama amblycephala]
MMFDILPTLQFILLFYMFGSSGAGFIIVVMLPVLLMMTDDRCFDRCRCRLSCSPSVTRTVMLIFILVINAVIICFYMTLEKTTDQVGWGCVMVYLQIHWAVVKFTDPYYLISFSQNFHRFVPVYVFGSVGFILLTSTALTTELILKAVNGDRTVGDLRFIVFPFECFFAVSLLLSGLFASKITNCIQSCQKQNTAETQQIKYTKADDEDEDSVVLSVENK